MAKFVVSGNLVLGDADVVVSQSLKQGVYGNEHDSICLEVHCHQAIDRVDYFELQVNCPRDIYFGVPGEK